MESKQQTITEPPAPAENPSEEASLESSGFGTQGKDEEWAEQVAKETSGDQGDDTSKKLNLFSTKYSMFF